MKYPPLPTEIHGLAGPIKIDRPIVVDPLCPTDVGQWRGDERRVLIRSTLKRPIAWHILLHELCHAALEEAGVNGLTHNKEEAICEAVASGMIHVCRHLMTHHARP